MTTDYTYGILNLLSQFDNHLRLIYSQVTEKLATPPTSASSSRIGSCCELLHLSSRAKPKVRCPTVLFSSKHFTFFTTGILNGANTMNASSDLKKDIKARHDGQKHFGYDVWFAGHRNGASGVQNPYTADIQGPSALTRCIVSESVADDITAYKDAVAWIKEQIESNEKYRTDDTRFWVQVHAI